MSGNETEQLSGVIPELERQIAIAKGHGLGIATQLLEMARLELMLQLHGISNEELADFCAAIDPDVGPAQTVYEARVNATGAAPLWPTGPSPRRQSLSRSRVRVAKGAY